MDRLFRSLRHHEALLPLLGSVAVLAIAAVLLAFGGPQATPEEEDAAIAEAPQKDGTVLVRSSIEGNDLGGSTRYSSSMLRFARTPGGALPEILSEQDKLTYRKAFAHLKEGNWSQMQQAVGELENTVLVGHLAAEKALHQDYGASYEELASWMRRYADHPQAKRMDALARARKTHGGLQKAAYRPTPYLNGYGDSNGLAAPIAAYHAYMLDWDGREAAHQGWRDIHEMLETGSLAAAREMLERAEASRSFRALEADIARWSLANASLAYGQDNDAFREAKRAAARSGDRIPGVYWTAGLAAWRLGNIETAGAFFAKQAREGRQSAWDISQGAFWAFRAFQRMENPALARKYLRIAARYPRTFYGILARREMNQPLEIDNDPSPGDKESLALLMNIPAVQRAVALVEIGQQDLAEREIRNLFLHISDDLAEGLLTVAHRLDLPAVQIRMARALLDRQQSTRMYDFARYPAPNWQPMDGYRIDPSLLFALTRQESGFNPTARSTAGARGLMQIMPDTAKYVAANESLPFDDTESLYDPIYNMTLGQAYVAYLLTKPEINHNLLFLAAAYNAGPGNLEKWRRNVDFQNDPLLFIESIPIRETQNYVEQVIANYWIYKELAGEPAQSLDQLVSGRWPEYDARQYLVAGVLY